MKKMSERRTELNPGATTTRPVQRSFFRSGKISNWSESFTDEALEWFEARAGKELQLLGYPLKQPRM